MIKGLIFDLDGVIVNTEKNHFLAWKQIASELGLFFSEKENELLKGIKELGFKQPTPIQNKVIPHVLFSLINRVR